MAEAFVSPDRLRARFATAMSDMYRVEVPLYGRLVELVQQVNRESAGLAGADDFALDRVGSERHGAIRLGTAAELSLIARAFAVLGMEPVGYYDLASAGLPVHSTAFRPITASGLEASPFRVFTSLLRLELIEPPSLRQAAEKLLSERSILTPAALRLIEVAERANGLSETQGEDYVTALVETFRWHERASVTAELYAELSGRHRLIADIVGFRGPHINHLTPRVLDIDLAQARMAEQGFDPKKAIEGPPQRRCPLLLRQTSFKALSEPILFPNATGSADAGVHVARFGEVEQRGVALTPEGRARYDGWITQGGDLAAALPDDWRALHAQGLAYFRYRAGSSRSATPGADIETLIDEGVLTIEPILYEDFLPVSAAGIFRSNLGGEASASVATDGNRAVLEAAIGKPIHDEFALYARESARSLADCADHLGALPPSSI